MPSRFASAFPGAYTLVREEPQLAAALARLRGPVVALDSETTFFDHRPCLVQLAVPGVRPVLIDCVAIDLSDVSAALEPLVADPAIEKLIHNASFDRRVFRTWLGLDMAGVTCTLAASRARYGGRAGHGLKDLARRVLGVELDKGARMTDWSTRPLSRSQLVYAAADVEVLIEVHRAWG